MVEKAHRGRVEETQRSPDEEREWELFVREDEGDPLKHVGSVTAPTADTAHEEASRLFAWYAEDMWICPADEVVRYSTSAIDDVDDAATPDDGTESRTHEL